MVRVSGSPMCTGLTTPFERVTTDAPSEAQLKSLVGTYRSDEAEVEMVVAIVGGNLVLKHRPDVTIALTPSYGDVFSGSIGVVRFHRDAGRVTGFSVVQDRVWDLRFTRQAGT